MIEVRGKKLTFQPCPPPHCKRIFSLFFKAAQMILFVYKYVSLSVPLFLAISNEVSNKIYINLTCRDFALY